MKKQQLQAILSEQQLWGLPQPIDNIAPTSNNSTNDHFLIESGNAQFVLRIHNVFSEQLGIDRHLELQVLQTIADLNIAPELMYYDPNHRYQITQFVDGRHIELSDLSATQKDNLFDTINSYQRITNINKTTHYVNSIVQLQQQIGSNVIDKQLLNAMQQMQDTLPHCLNHHDLRAENIIWQGNHCIIIDWEFAANGLQIWDWNYIQIYKHNISPPLIEFMQLLNRLWYQLAQQLQETTALETLC